MTHLKIIFTLLILVYSIAPCAANQTPALGTGSIDAAQAPAQGGAGGCNWDEFKKRLGGQESGGGECENYQGSGCEKQYTALYDQAHQTKAGVRDVSMGKYQFIPSLWVETLGGEYSQCLGYNNLNAPHTSPPSKSALKGPNKPNMFSEDCWKVQEWAMDKILQDYQKKMEEKNWCGMLGQPIANSDTEHWRADKSKGRQYKGSCTVTKSGLLSAVHNTGKNGDVCGRINGNGRVGRHLRYRICDNQNIPIGGQCEPDKPTIPDTIKPPTTVTPLNIQKYVPSHFYDLSDTLKYVWVAGFQLMTNQLSTTMMQQVQIIGTFFDAKHQLETQRLIQQKYAEAHKDYHPSKQMCEIGTFVRNLSNTEKRAELTQAALSRAMLDRALSIGDSKTMDIVSDEDSRLNAYIFKFCSIKDNAKQNEKLCKKSGPVEQQNADISYTSTIDTPLTLDINLLDGSDPTKQEENIFAFLDYIFMHDRFPWDNGRKTILHRFIPAYQDMRSIVAMRSVAQNSFAHIIAEKTAGPENEDESVAPFIKSLMREMLQKDNESDAQIDQDIEETIGKNPSYYAQMEVLTKKIYQHPEFMVNLYDKPANVKRIRAAMTAIKVMQDRDIHDAMLRREMLMSMLLELQLREEQNNLTNTEIRKVLAEDVGSAAGAPNGGGFGGGATPDDGFAE